VLDIIKAYYDKKNLQSNGTSTVTADQHVPAPARSAAVVTPVVGLKPEEATTTPAHTSERDPNLP
jgi:hypothetical protein